MTERLVEIVAFNESYLYSVSRYSVTKAEAILALRDLEQEHELVEGIVEFNGRQWVATGIIDSHSQV